MLDFDINFWVIFGTTFTHNKFDNTLLSKNLGISFMILSNCPRLLFHPHKVSQLHTTGQLWLSCMCITLNKLQQICRKITTNIVQYILMDNVRAHTLYTNLQ